MRIPLLAVILCSLSTSVAFSQKWAADMFDHTSHDFGIVARGAKVEHRFTIENIYNETLRVVSVNSSCKCTLPSITKRELKTYEKSEIVISIDTIGHRGRKDATIHVVLQGVNHSFRATVQLNSYVFIRDDVTFSPGVAKFGSVAQGTTTRQKVTVSHRGGRGTWRIIGVEPTRPYYEVTPVEQSRHMGRVTYDLWITLKPDAPVGYLHDFIMLKTNDQNIKANRVSLAVEGMVVSELLAKPSPLPIGTLKTNEKTALNLVVHGQSPFRVLNVKGPDKRYSFKMSKSLRTVHLIPVTFQADNQTGKLSGEIRVDTDLKGGQTVVVTIEGQVLQGGPKTPEVTPDESTPDEATPDEATPDEATPDESTPDESTPDESTPDESTPDESTPDEATPDESTPDEATPDESTPDESTPDELSDGPSL